MVNESLTAELERYKERVTIFKQRQNVDLNKSEKLIDSQMDDLIQNRNAKFAAFQQEIDTLKQNLSDHVKEKESLSTTLIVFKTESKEKEYKYIDKEIVLENQNKELEDILFLGYQNPFHLKKAQRIKPTLYDGSIIAKEHDVIFVIVDEETLILEEKSRSKMLDKQNEQALWLKHSNYNPDTSVKSHTPVRIEAPSKLPKVREVLNIQKLVLQNAFEIQLKQLSIDNDQLLKQIMSQEIVHIAMNSVDTLDVNKSCVDECNKCLELETEPLKKKDLIEKDSVENSYFNAQLQENVFAITALKNELRKLKEKNVVNNAVSKPIAIIASGMFKLDIEPISHRLKNNRDAHEVYLEKTIENTDTLCGLVECTRKHNPSEPLLESACMFTKQVKELLVYVSKTCPSLTKPCKKLVAVTPMNKDKKVRFVEHVTSSSNIPKQTDSLKTKDSNKPLLTSTGVNTTTSASGSKPSGNTKKHRISRPPCSNQKIKVEEHPRKVKSSLNKMNFVSEPISNAHVKHCVRNAKFESI
ncbi:hypothetical protein Tco_0408047 [Tanacetum coccineum]